MTTAGGLKHLGRNLALVPPWIEVCAAIAGVVALILVLPVVALLAVIDGIVTVWWQVLLLVLFSTLPFTVPVAWRVGATFLRVFVSAYPRPSFHWPRSRTVDQHLPVPEGALL